MPVAHTYTHTHTVPHELIIVFPAPVSRMYTPKRQIHNLSKRQEKNSCIQTLTEQTDTFLWLILSIKTYTITYIVTRSHKRVIKAEVCHFLNVKTLSPVPV